jgi:predicted HAD superfamily Cof-like phosphohydrolase
MTLVKPIDSSVISINFRSFESQILYFNGMYSLPIASYPTILPVAVDTAERRNLANFTTIGLVAERLKEFKKILLDEVSEVEDIIAKCEESTSTEEDILTELADWLCDIQIYCASEMVRFGLPQKECMNIIMASNFSKLGADGKPILADGKVQKGPFYWKPEPRLKQMLLSSIAEAAYAAQEKRVPLGDD